MTKIKAKIQLRRDTSANFTSINPTLLLGEFAFETDTMVITEGGSVSVKLKIGDGVNPWAELPYTTFGFQAVTWDDISGKPTEFAPAPHTHEITDVIGLETILEAIAESIPAAQIQSDWNQTNSSALDFIKNKPAIPASGLPAGGTAGQILTKVDETDYNANWQENFADWTSQVKHIVKNNGLGGTITKGTAVYVTGSNGTNMLVGRASNASEATSSKTMGLMQSDITTTGGNQTGFVITEGLLGGLNTAGQTAGDPVWLGVNGALIYGLANKPYAPAHLVFIGIVTKVSAGSGEIFIKVQNGFELKEIHDVDLITTTPINGHVLGFDGTLWVNKTVAGWLGFTPVTETRTINTTAPLIGGGDLSGNRTISITQANASTDGYLSATDWNTFNNKFSLPTLTAGSILFSNGTTIAQNNANLFWDNTNSRLGIGTASPSATIHSVGSVTAATAIARGNYLQPTLVASANNDVLVGLDIAPTFTTGTFTGVSTFGIRVTGALRSSSDVQAWNGTASLSANSLSFNNTSTTARISASSSTTNLAFRIGSTDYAQFFNTTGNLVLQSGGTFTDAGYKLDVVGGDARINTLTIGLGGGQVSANTALGFSALNKNTTGSDNTAIGSQALLDNTTGSANTAVGYFASEFNITGSNNTALGYASLLSNLTTSNHTAIGTSSLRNITSGSYNIAFGVNAGRYIADGTTNLTTCNTSIFIGGVSKPLANSQTNQIVIGYNAIGAGSNTATLGNTSIVDTILRGRVNIQQYATGSRPTYVKGALIYDSTLGKLVVGGNAGWEVVTSA